MLFLLGIMVLFALQPTTATFALQSCLCTYRYRPVCGSNGRTYTNKCWLQCDQLSNPDLFMERTGACDDDDPLSQYCICTLNYNPVCGTDGKTYPNKCTLGCAQRSAPITLAHNGKCRQKRENAEQLNPDCKCPETFDPVCGNDGQTYLNQCTFECSRAKNTALREDNSSPCKIKPSRLFCICSLEYNPVCGSDGKTYSNPCSLRCESKTNKDLKQSHEGKCSHS